MLTDKIKNDRSLSDILLFYLLSMVCLGDLSTYILIMAS